MSLFDNIKCDYPAKIPKILKNKWFQTKSLGCNLDKYLITKQGKLIKNKAVNKIIDYHGDINFYTFTGSHEENNFKWYEYTARFTNGKLQWIKKIKSKP